MNAPENPPAFPSVCLGDPDHPASTPGMTLRDWLAGQMLAASVPGDKPEWMAEHCYRIADAMLAARAKGTTGREAA